MRKGRTIKIALARVPATDTGADGTAELGSFGFRRASTAGSLANDRANLAGAVGWQWADGINAVSSPGDKDGYRNLSARARGSWNAAPDLQLGAAGFALSGRSDFDGFDNFGRHVDTLDNSRNRLLAARLWGEYGSEQSAWHARLGVSLLGSRNRNFLDEDEINRTSGRRATVR